MLSQTAGYAVLALGHVALADGEPLLVKDIARLADVPYSYLAKIINTLSRKGFVHTQRGIGGGVTLSRPPQEITLFDLCVALDDPLVQKRCMLGLAQCSDERACPAHQFWGLHRDKQIAFLHSRTLADIAAFEVKNHRTQKQRQRKAG